MDPTKWNAPFAVIVAALFVIVFFRANATYWVGRGLTAGSRRTRLARWLETPSYLRAERWLQDWGASAVAVCFVAIGIQTMVNLAAGAARMPLRRYLPAVAVGSLMWAFIYATVGLAGFEAFSALWERSPAMTIILLALFATGIAIAMIVRIRRRPVVD